MHEYVVFGKKKEKFSFICGNTIYGKCSNTKAVIAQAAPVPAPAPAPGTLTKLNIQRRRHKPKMEQDREGK